jgi:hypothetical protein
MAPPSGLAGNTSLYHRTGERARAIPQGGGQSPPRITGSLGNHSPKISAESGNKNARRNCHYPGVKLYLIVISPISAYYTHGTE